MFVVSIWIFAFACVFIFVNAATQYPLGINLGPKYITAAFIHQNGTTAHVTYMKGSAAYQFVMAPPEGSGDSNAALVPKILRTTFNGIKSSADMALNEKIRHAVISVPNHTDDDMREAIERAAKLTGYSPTISNLKDPILKHIEAVGLAYSLDVPEALGRISVLVDYNEGSLELWIVNNGMVGKPKGHVIFPELGVLAIVDEAADTYFLTVQRRTENFLRKHLVDGDGKPVGLRAVVLAGDASEKGMDGMKDVLVMVLGDLGYKGALGLVKDSVDALYVGAMGAAMRGKEMMREPERFARKASGGHGEL